MTDRPPSDTPFDRAVARLSERRAAFQRQLADKKEAALKSAVMNGCPYCGSPAHPEALILHEWPGETHLEGDMLHITARFQIFCMRCDPLRSDR